MNIHLFVDSFTQAIKHRNALAFHITFSPKVVIPLHLGRSSDLLYLVDLPVKNSDLLNDKTLTELTAAGTVQDLNPIPF